MEFIDLKTQRSILGSKIDNAVLNVINHGQFILGPEVSQLEEALSKFTQSKHVITCANGTDALVMVLLAWGIGPGDAVIVPSFTFVATAEAVCLTGATPVFVDVKEDYNIDTEALPEAVKTAEACGLKPKAIIPVDLFGLPADYEKIKKFAHPLELKVLADAAQSMGAELEGRRVGTLADATTTSFFPAKPLGCYGDGGAIFTDDDELADSLRSIRLHGKGRDKYDNVRVGLNSRLDTIQAAILLQKLTIFEDEIEKRQRVADFYFDNLPSSITLPQISDTKKSVFAQFTVRLDERDLAAQGLSKNNIPNQVYYKTPLHRQTAYKTYPQSVAECKMSEKLSADVLSLPMHPYLSDEDQALIANVFKTMFS